MAAEKKSAGVIEKKWREETHAWTEAYGDPGEIERRRRAMPDKLKLLGLDRANRSDTILDLCCGNGEALNALYEMGFRNLSGGDIAVPDYLSQDGRFAVRICDAADPSFRDEEFDWVLIIHAMHHLGLSPQIERVLRHCHRMLKPGGRLAVVDFPNSLQIRLAFWWFRQGLFLWTPYLKHFGQLIHEEWPFLKNYLPEFPKVRSLLLNSGFELESRTDQFFYFYWTLRKPLFQSRT
jgi:ubiquinone/menaquinone biosynthesis C-methylase UbiE